MKTINCPVCSEPISVRPARGRSSNKPFIMLVCPQDGRHFRAFITEQKFVAEVFEEQPPAKGSGTGTGSAAP